MTALARSPRAAETVGADGALPVTGGLDVPSLTRAFAGATAVVHLAQIGSTRDGTYEDVNVGGTQAVVEAALGAGVARVVFFSGLGVARYGISPRSTNAYFLSKLAAELALFRSWLDVVVFRPSYIVGPGDSLVTSLLGEMAAGVVERPGDGQYRLQPVAIKDAAAAVLAALERPPIRAGAPHRVFDLVGPEALGYDAFIGRLAAAARTQGRPAAFTLCSVPVEEADAQARAGGYRGMGPDDLDCLLCDETADPRPLEALLGRSLVPLDDALAAAVRGARR